MIPKNKEVLFYWRVDYTTEETEKSTAHKWFDVRILLNENSVNRPVYAIVLGNIAKFRGHPCIVVRQHGYAVLKPDREKPDELYRSELERIDTLTLEDIVNATADVPLEDNPAMCAKAAWRCVRNIYESARNPLFQYDRDRWGYVDGEPWYVLDVKGHYEEEVPDNLNEAGFDFNIPVKQSAMEAEIVESDSSIEDWDGIRPTSTELLLSYRKFLKNFEAA